MRFLVSVVGLFVLALAVVGCSGGREKPTPAREQNESVSYSACSKDPREFAEAEKVRDFGSDRGCGVRNAWRLFSVNGVRLSQPTIVNCATANSLSIWITKVMQPAAERRYGERVTAITVPDGYSCRTRNNVRGAKLSEHAHGNAIDISGFTLEGGERVTVEQGWFGKRKAKKFLAVIRSGGCGPFKTVLGPGVAYHDDHLHFDMQRHRSGGTYCR